MAMGRGSDTRMYNPRSDSSHLYTGGDDRERDKYRYGDGDSEHMDDIKGKEQKENERIKVSSAPHLKIEVPNHAPPEEEEGGFEDEHTPPQMEEGENAVGAEVSQLTAPSGYVDSGLNVSAGAMAGPGAALGGYRPMLATGEPMDMAFRLLKIDMDDIEGYERLQDYEKNTRRTFPEGRRKLRSMGIGENRGAGGAGGHGGKSPSSVSMEGEWDKMKVHPGSLGHIEHMRQEMQERDNPWTEGTEFSLPKGFTHSQSGWDFASPPFMPEREYTTHKDLQGYPFPKGWGFKSITPDDPKYAFFYGEESDDEIEENDDRKMTHYPVKNTWEGPMVEDDVPSFVDIPFNQNTGFTRSEPMDMVFSSLMKGKSAAESKVWSQPKFKYRNPGGRRPWIASQIKGKSASRRLAPRTEHGGLTENKYAVEPSHGGRSVVQPLKLFPAEYRQRKAQSQRIKLQGGMSMPYSSHAPYGQLSMAGVGRLTGQLPGQAAAAKVPALSKPKAIPKVKNVFKSDILKFNIDYLHYSQLRNLLRQVKHALADKEGARKALPTSGGGPGEVGQAGHRDGGTTRPEGGTENIDENDNPINWAAYPSEVARGSGHV